MIEKICSLIILKIASKTTIESSFQFRNILLNGLGIIEDESYLIKKLSAEGLLTYEGSFDNSNFYKSVSTTKKGIEYLNRERENIIIPRGEFSKEREIILKKILGI